MAWLMGIYGAKKRMANANDKSIPGGVDKTRTGYPRWTGDRDQGLHRRLRNSRIINDIGHIFFHADLKFFLTTKANALTSLKRINTGTYT